VSDGILLIYGESDAIVTIADFSQIMAVEADSNADVTFKVSEPPQFSDGLLLRVAGNATMDISLNTSAVDISVQEQGDLYIHGGNCGTVHLYEDGLAKYQADSFKVENYVLEKINLETKEVAHRFIFPNNNSAYATKMTMNNDKTDIWIIYEGIKHISVTDTSYDDYINKAYFETPYGIGVSFNDEIYVADAGNYTEEGKVLVFDKNRVLVKTYVTGIIPGSFAFYKLDE
jgi:hypothetical protein